MSKESDPIAKIGRQIDDLTSQYVNTGMSVDVYSKRRRRLVEKRDRMVKAYKRKVLNDGKI